MLKHLAKPRRPLSVFAIRPYSSTVKYPPPYAHYEPKKSPKRTFKLGVILFVLGATITYNYPLYTLGETLIKIPDEKDEAGTKQYIDNLESSLQSLPLVAKYRSNPDYVESRGWDNLDNTTLGLSNFHGSLAKPGGIAIPPINFHNDETGDDMVILHVGIRLSGYPFIVHGGILGTVVDEVFKSNIRKEFNIDINKIHTTSLQLNYSFPTFVNQFIVIRSSVSKINSSDNVYNVESDVSTMGNMLLMKASSTLKSDTPPAKQPKLGLIQDSNDHKELPTKKKGWFW